MVLSTDPEQTRRICSVEAHLLRSPRDLLFSFPWGGIHRYAKHFRRVDACILSGGTPVYDHDHLSRIIHCSLPWILRRKLICFGIGVRRIRSIAGRSAIKALLGRSFAISTRDPNSKRELRAIGINRKINVTGDSALFLKPQNPPSKILAQLKPEENRPLIAISPRVLSTNYRAHYHARLLYNDINRIRWKLAEAADYLSAIGHVVFIPFNRSLTDNDVAEIVLVRALMKNPSMVLNDPLSPEELAGLLGKMDLVIGLRLHSLILAAAQGTPVASIDYDPKIRGFMEYAGIPEQVCEIQDPTKMLTRCVEEGLQNQGRLKNRLLRVCENMKNKIAEEAQYISELLTTY
jgi:polysaccharide pyruvyl transferase WcaK-like protein